MLQMDTLEHASLVIDDEELARWCVQVKSACGLQIGRDDATLLVAASKRARVDVVEGGDVDAVGYLVVLQIELVEDKYTFTNCGVNNRNIGINMYRYIGINT